MYEDLRAVRRERFGFGTGRELVGLEAARFDRAFDHSNGHLREASPSRLLELIREERESLGMLEDLRAFKLEHGWVPQIEVALGMPHPVAEGWAVFDGDVTVWSEDLDYKVTVEVLVTEGTVEIGALTFRPLPNGPAIGARRIQKARVGRVVDLALVAMTRPRDDASIRLTATVRDLPAAVRRKIAGSEPARPVGHPAYSDEELRALAVEYVNAPSRGRQQAVSHAYNGGSLSAWGPAPSAGAIRQRVRAARRRLDPLTGEPFLGPASKPIQ